MTAVATARPLVIGVGNPWRGDDGLGAAVVAELAEVPGLDTALCDGEPASLMALWEGRERVFVVDALVTGAPPGSLHRLTAEAPLPRRSGPSSHGLGLAEAVELARALGALPPQLILYGLEAGRLAAGRGLSPAVAQRVAALAARLRAEALAGTDLDNAMDDPER